MAVKKSLVIIGFGGMGFRHAGHAGKSEGVDLLGIYDIKEERRAAAHEEVVRAMRVREAAFESDRIGAPVAFTE